MEEAWEGRLGSSIYILVVCQNMPMCHADYAVCISTTQRPSTPTCRQYRSSYSTKGIPLLHYQQNISWLVGFLYSHSSIYNTEYILTLPFHGNLDLIKNFYSESLNWHELHKANSSKYSHQLYLNNHVDIEIHYQMWDSLTDCELDCKR